MNDSPIWRPSLALLSQARMEHLHEAATNILETTGLNVHHPAMRRKLAEAGATVMNDLLVRIPKGMVKDALGTAKHNVVVHNRLGQPVMPLGPHQIYFGLGSDLIYSRDVETGERRLSTLDDVGQASRLCDALDEIDFVMSFALPEGASTEDTEPQQYYAMLRNTVKPIIMTSFSGLPTLERMHAMACLVAGGDRAFREKPNYIMYGQFVSPLQHDLGAIERLVFCADHGIPLIYVPTIMPGVSGPITLAGSLALSIAECLAGLVMHQLQRPGAPFIFGACVSQMDMRTMLFPYGSPEWRLNDLVMAEMSRYYRLPVFGTGGATDSKVVDAQAGAEYASSLLVAAMAGTNLIHDVGYLDSGMTGSLESILLGAEQIRWVRQFMAGMSVSQDTLAAETIAEVGPGKQFLEHAHTIEHLRRVMWQPYVTDRNRYDAWSAAGGKDYALRAREHCRQLLKSHEPQPIELTTEASIRDICKIHPEVEK
jgi:trimethylamine---corrinoid protein Co-methyltransferase